MNSKVSSNSKYAEQLARLEQNNGAILHWQVGNPAVWNEAVGQGFILFDGQTDCYVHPLAFAVDGGGYRMAAETLDALRSEYLAWNDAQGLDLGSADEHLTDQSLTLGQREYLSEFCDRWVLAERAEEIAAARGRQLTQGQRIMQRLHTAGFEIVETGGGCTAWRLALPRGCYMLVTDDASHELTDGATVGLYDADGDEITIAYNQF